VKGRCYFDSSAWFKRYFKESGTEEVQALLARAEEVCFSEVGVPEIFSVLRRQVRERVISEGQYQAVKQAVGEDIRATTVYPLDQAIVADAIVCLEKASLQGCDSIHVATARVHRCNLFVSADVQQCKAAKALGLKVMAL
jgi:predicted nucleic acid-binding protein